VERGFARAKLAIAELRAPFDYEIVDERPGFLDFRQI
jgi:hypothetical protein